MSTSHSISDACFILFPIFNQLNNDSITFYNDLPCTQLRMYTSTRGMFHPPSSLDVLSPVGLCTSLATESSRSRPVTARRTQRPLAAPGGPGQKPWRSTTPCAVDPVPVRTETSAAGDGPGLELLPKLARDGIALGLDRPRREVARNCPTGRQGTKTPKQQEGLSWRQALRFRPVAFCWAYSTNDLHAPPTTSVGSTC